MGVLVGGGITQHAVQQHQVLAAMPPHKIHRRLDFRQRRGPRREQHRLARLRHRHQQRIVRQVCRGHLERLHPQRIEEFHRVQVKGGRQPGDPNRLRILVQCAVLGLAKAVGLLEDRVLRSARLGVVPIARGAARHQFFRLIRLEFDGICPGLPRLVDQPLGGFQAALVVHSGLGNDIGRTAGADQFVAYPYRFHPFSRFRSKSL